MFQSHSHVLAVICLKLLFSAVVDCDIGGCAEVDIHHPALDKYKEEDRCNQPSFVTGNAVKYCMNKTDVIYNLNNITGKLDVDFKIRPDIEKYEFDLRVGNVSNEQECNTNISFMLHSTKTFHAPICKSNQSGECQNICYDTGRVSFNFVYTDCYKLDVRLTMAWSNGCGDFSSSTVFYDTKCVKTRPAFMYSKINTSYNRKLNQLTLTDNYNWLETNIHLFAVNVTTVWALVLYPTKDIETVILSNNNNNTTNNSIACTKTKNDDVACILSDVVASKMSICSITLNTATRCKDGTIWTLDEDYYSNRCAWEFFYTPIGEDTKILSGPTDGKDSSIERIIWISITVIGFMLIIINIIYWLWNKRGIKPTVVSGRPQDCDPQLSTKPNQQLLLLYARDCPPFMDLMKSFRQILEEYAHFEVYDCYDESRHWAEKSVNPSSWMLRLVADQSVKIIVISSKCAYMRQQALSSLRTIRYAEPNANDRLFMPALQYLNETLTQHDYKKVFVVRFDGFSDDSVLFTHINEYTRFALPKHFQELINCLQEAAISNNVTELDDLKALQILQHDLTKLTKYVDQNRNYLSTLLFETDLVV